MKKEIAIVIKAGSLLLHPGPTNHTEDFHPVLYTERQTVRIIGALGRRTTTYAIARGEQLQFNLRKAMHHMHYCWHQCQRYWQRMQLAFNY